MFNFTFSLTNIKFSLSYNNLFYCFTRFEQPKQRVVSKIIKLIHKPTAIIDFSVL